MQTDFKGNTDNILCFSRTLKQLTRNFSKTIKCQKIWLKMKYTEMKLEKMLGVKQQNCNEMILCRGCLAVNA